MFTLDRSFIESERSFASVRLLSIGMSGYISMFLPIIVAFPFMVGFCSERNSGCIRLAIARTGQLRYSLSKFTASFLSGGFATMLGLIIFGIIITLVFPGIDSYKLPEEELKYLIPFSPAKTIMMSVLSAFVYGAFTTLPAFFLSSFCRDPYIIVCIPFLLVYVWRTLIEKLANIAIEHQNFGLADTYYSLYPEAVNNLFTAHEWNDSLSKTLIFNLGLLVFSAGGFLIIFRLRQDKGR